MSRDDAIPSAVAPHVVWTAMAAMTALYFWSYFHRIAIPGTVFNELQTDMGMSAAAVTGLAAIYLYPYAVVQVGVGLAADRWGGMRVLLWGGALMGIGAICFPLSGSVVALYVTRAMVGLGASCMYLCLVKELDSLFDRQRFAPLLGIVMFVGLAGGLAGTLPLERAVATWGWRPALLGVGLLTGLTFLVAWFRGLALRGRRQSLNSSLSLWPIVLVLRNRDSWPVLLAAGINFSLYFVIQGTIGKKMLEDCAGVTSSFAAGATFGMVLIAMVSIILVGFICRAIGDRRKPLIIISAMMNVMAAAVLFAASGGQGSVGWYLVAFGLIAIASGASLTYTCVIREVNSARHVALAASLCNGLTYVAVAVLGNGVGWIMDRWRDEVTVTAEAMVYPHGAYRVVAAWMLGLALVLLLAGITIRETRGESRENPKNQAPNPK